MTNNKIFFVTIFLILSKVGLSQDLKSDLLAIWEFDEYSENDVYDSHNANNGTISGSVQIANQGKIGGAYLFKGNDPNYVEIPEGLIAGNQAISISVWFKANTLNGSRGIISSFFDQNSRAFLIRTNGTSLDYFTDTNFNTYTGGAYTNITTGVWYHVIATYDGMSMKLYINGILDDSSYSTSGVLGGSYDNVGYIGNYKTSTSSDLSWDGLIDQVAIWNRVLTTEEVTALYNEGKGLQYLQWTNEDTNNSQCEYLICDGSNIGIGTSDTKGYKLAVAGKTITEELKVALVENWPDFVFEKNFELRTLDEIEKYIGQNKHLPEIPSQANVTENGINLGEMNAKLLQKIEELTLYLIEQNKRLDAQQKEIEGLKAQIKN